MRRLWTGGPVEDFELGRYGTLWWLGWNNGISLARDGNGTWSQVQYGIDDEYSSYTFLLRGGYQRIVPEAYYQELVAAGYGGYFRDLDEYTNTMLYEYED